MRILHLADLHLGKRVNDFSMIDDQKYMLNQIVDIIKLRKIDTVLICGDLYDKKIPPNEAIILLDKFLTDLYNLQLNVFIIAGNHDSADRLSYGKEILKFHNIHVVSEFKGQIPCINIGEVDFYLLPFIKYQHVNYYLEQKFTSDNDAIAFLIDNLTLDYNHRNIMLAHQYVIGADQMLEFEELNVGDAQGINYEIFNKFDYVALGHVHKPMYVGNEKCRYSGSILKYSFKEASYRKSVSIYDTTLNYIDQYVLTPKHDLLTFEAYLQDIIEHKTLKQYPEQNYYQIILLDEEDIIDAIGQVRNVYPNVMQINFKKRMNLKQEDLNISENKILQMNPLDLFMDFYQQMNHCDLNDQQIKILKNISGGEQ